MRRLTWLVLAWFNVLNTAAVLAAYSRYQLEWEQGRASGIVIVCGALAILCFWRARVAKAREALLPDEPVPTEPDDDFDRQYRARLDDEDAMKWEPKR